MGPQTLKLTERHQTPPPTRGGGNEANKMGKMIKLVREALPTELNKPNEEHTESPKNPLKPYSASVFFTQGEDSVVRYRMTSFSPCHSQKIFEFNIMIETDSLQLG